MSNMSNLKIETGSSPAEERFSITVTETGPYLVYGRPPLAEQFIMPDESNDSWYFQEGRHFSTNRNPRRYAAAEPPAASPTVTAAMKKPAGIRDSRRSGMRCSTMPK